MTKERQGHRWNGGGSRASDGRRTSVANLDLNLRNCFAIPELLGRPTAIPLPRARLAEAQSTFMSAAPHFFDNHPSRCSPPHNGEGGGHPLFEQFALFESADRHIKVSYQAVGKRIDPTVDTEAPAARPGALHNDVRGDISDLPDDIKFA